MVATCLGCYSNWFLKRVDGYLWRWRAPSLSSICGTQTTTFNLRVSTALIIITLRCCFWSPIILLVCVARQVALSLCLWLRSDLRNHIVSSHQVTQSFLPRVARPTPSSSSSEAKLSSGTVSSGTGSRAGKSDGKSDGKRSKTKWIWKIVGSGIRLHVSMHLSLSWSFSIWK